jgi:glycosyltransferase involved in cell wall biosynthesis
MLQKGVLGLNRRISAEATHRTNGALRLLRAAAVAELARERAVERIHAHWPRPTEVALLAQAMTGLPMSVSIHAHEVAHDAGHLPAAFERIDFAAFCNAASMELTLSKLPTSVHDKARLVYHGVDLDQFPLTALPPLSGGKLHLVTAGRLTRTKGMDRLIQAVASARAGGVDLDLTIIGDGGERGQLEERARTLGVGEEVRFTGWVPHERMRAMLAEAHLFALFADDSFHDGLPNVVLEALALGRPAILTPLPAAREVINPGENGALLSRVDATDELQRICHALIADPSILAAWSAAASLSVREAHDRARQLDRLCSLFESA